MFREWANAFVDAYRSLALIALAGLLFWSVYAIDGLIRYATWQRMLIWIAQAIVDLALVIAIPASLWGLFAMGLAAFKRPRPRAFWPLIAAVLLAYGVGESVLAWLGTWGVTIQPSWRYIIIVSVVLIFLTLGSVRHGGVAPAVKAAIAWRDRWFRFISWGVLPVALGVALAGNLYPRPTVDALSLAGQPSATPDRSTPPLPSSGTDRTKRRPNIILISIDTLTARDMSLYGYHLSTTPRLEAFAQHAYVFDHATANCNFTAPSITSLLTGRYPTTHRIFSVFADVQPGLGLPTVLREQGYHTIGIVANGVAHPGNLGLAAGFDLLLGPTIGLSDPLSPGQDWGSLLWNHPNPFIAYAMDRAAHHPVHDCDGRDERYRHGQAAEAVTEAGIGVVDHELDDRPFFLWTHYLPPHYPYLASPPFMGRFLTTERYRCQSEQGLREVNDYGFYLPEDQGAIDTLRLRYDESIAYVDAEIGRYLDHLERKGLLQDSLVIIVGDHGESFEKGYWQHSGPLMHEALLHVPLLIHLPGQTAGGRLDEPAELVDLMPTVIDYLGLPLLPTQGRVLAFAPRDVLAADPLRFAVNFDHDSRFELRRSGSLALYDGQHQKAIWRLDEGLFSLYDLARDPDEMHDLAPGSSARVRRYLDAFRPRLLESLPRERTPDYQVGDWLDLSATGNAAPHLVYGWSEGDSTGRLIKGPEAGLLLPLEDSSRPLQLEIKPLGLSSPDGIVPPSLRILVNGQLLAELTIDMEDAPVQRIDLPVTQPISDNIRHHDLLVAFQPGRPFSSPSPNHQDDIGLIALRLNDRHSEE